MSTSAIIDRIRSLLETTPPFSDLTPDERQDVLGDVSIEYYKPGEVILEQGAGHHPGLYLVESGLVRLMDVEQQRLVDKCQEGDFFGSFGLLKGGATLYQAKAVEDTVCALVRVRRFQQLYKENEAFQLFFEQDIRRYMRYLDASRDVSGRHLLLSHSLRHLVSRDPVLCESTDTIQSAAKEMGEQGVSSILVQRKGEIEGIVTDSDLREKVVAKAKPADRKIRQIMSSDVVRVSSDQTLFDAILKMLRNSVRRLLVETPDGTPLGVITDRDIAHVRGLDPVATLRKIEQAPTIERLAEVRKGVNVLLLHLYSHGVLPEEIKRIMALLHDGIAVRVLELEVSRLSPRERKMLRTTAWAWLRIGSGGRQEATLRSEQHNALVYAQPKDSFDGNLSEIFNKLAENVNTSLSTCGFALSDVVARDPAWRKPVREWKKSYRTWIHMADDEALRRIPFFFDLRSIFGDNNLVEELKQDLIDALNVQEMDEERRLIPVMAGHALEHKTPLSFFGGFVLERSGEHRNRLDIREHGILPIVDAARVLALDLRYFESVNTFDRLRFAKSELPQMKEELEGAQDAYNYFVDFRLEHQLKAVESGEEITNYIDPSLLSKLQQNLLKSAFKAANRLQSAIAKRYDISRGWKIVS